MPDSVWFYSDGIFPSNSATGFLFWEFDETGSLFHPSSNRSGAGEPTMADPSKLSRSVSPFTVVPNAIEVLERLRDSYIGLSEREALTGPDKAVRSVVEIALKHLARAV
jgi:hypothetical protein